MIQLQAINNILSSKNIEPYIRSNITREYLLDYGEEFEFILNHYFKYNKVPDDATFLAEFPDFNIIEVIEPVDFIIDNLKESYLYECGVELFQKSARMLEKNSYEGLQNIRDKADILLQHTEQRPLVDINSSDMIELKRVDLLEKMQHKGIIGISSGLSELDRILGGWLPGEELVIVLGRINQGKSWILEKFATEANKQKKRALYYSGEMGALQVSYRNDTLGRNYSNRQLMLGTISGDDFNRYIQDLNDNTNDTPFYVCTPTDLGNKYLSVGTLRTLIKTYKPDIVIIDQLSLMSDDLKGENKRIQLGNITMGLYNLSNEFKIPIIAASQANRNKSDMDRPENPELSDISESDAIGQNSSRVISLVQTKLGLSLKITKNRYGDNNQKLIYAWDIDCGTFRYVEVNENQEDDVQVGQGPIKPRNKSRKNLDVTDIF